MNWEIEILYPHTKTGRKNDVWFTDLRLDRYKMWEILDRGKHMSYITINVDSSLV